MPPKMNDNSMLVSSPEQEVAPIDRKELLMLGNDCDEVDNQRHNRTQHADEPDHIKFIEDHTEDDFLKRIYDNTVHGSCQLPETICQVNIEDQLDVFTHCRQPLSMFSFFREHETMENVGVVEILPAGAYLLPKFCEYCKAADTKDCPSHCDRPKLYFQKKRPPFQKLDPNRWNPQTDFALTAAEVQEAMRHDEGINDTDEVASLTSTDDGDESSFSQSKSRSADLTLQNYTTMTGESYETGVARRLSWLEMWSSSGD